MMKTLPLFFLIVFINLSIFGGNTDSDAVYEKIIKEYTLNDDGSTVFHYYKKIKLNTHFSFNRLYGETFIVYNPDYQDLKINFSRTTQENGNVVKTPENAFNEVLPRFARNAPHYNNLREMVVTHTGLELGAVIELDYTITSKPGFFPELMQDEILSESSPVQEMQINIQVPADRSLNYNVFNLRTAPELTETESAKTYMFKFLGLKENSHEYHQPDDNSHLPRLVFSTASFPEVIQLFSDQPSFSYKANDAMKELVENIKNESKNDVDLILKLRKIVAKNIVTYPVPAQYTGYKVRHSIDTWNSNGGTPCEKTLLLTSLLREAGLYAKPVFTLPTRLFDEQTGCLPLMEEVLLKISPRDREQMYISAVDISDQNMVFSLNKKTIVTLEPVKLNFEKIDENFENKVITNGTFSLDENLNISGSMETSMIEGNNPYYAILEDSSYAKSLVKNGFTGKGKTDFEIINSAQFRTLVHYTYEAEDPFRRQNNYYFLDLPENKLGTKGWRITSLNSKRFAPFEIPEIIDEQYSYTFEIPDQFELLNPVELTEKKNDFGEVIIMISQKNNKITVKKMLVVNKPIISPDQYPAFKEMMDLWNNKNNRMLVLKKQDGN